MFKTPGRRSAQAGKLQTRKIMYCPNCGTETSESRKFCRSCGMSLEIISQALTGQLQTLPTDTAMESAPAQSERRKMMRWGFGVFWLGILLAALLGILGGAISTLASQAGEFIASLAGLGGLIVLVGIGMMIYSRFLPNAPGLKTPAPLPQPRQTELPPAQRGVDMRPESLSPPVLSVTENTTELLDPSSHKERRQGE